MQKIEKINRFVENNSINDTIYAVNGKLINNTHSYPESYYSFEQQNNSFYVFAICRKTKRLIYNGPEEEVFILFLIKSLFVDFCKKNELIDEKIIDAQKNITIARNIIFYKNYQYYKIDSTEQIQLEKERLVRRAAHLDTFQEALESEGLVKNKIRIEKLLELMKLK